MPGRLLILEIFIEVQGGTSHALLDRRWERPKRRSVDDVAVPVHDAHVPINDGVVDGGRLSGSWRSLAVVWGRLIDRAGG